MWRKTKGYCVQFLFMTDNIRKLAKSGESVIKYLGNQKHLTASRMFTHMPEEYTHRHIRSRDIT